MTDYRKHLINFARYIEEASEYINNCPDFKGYIKEQGLTDEERSALLAVEEEACSEVWARWRREWEEHNAEIRKRDAIAAAANTVPPKQAD